MLLLCLTSSHFSLFSNTEPDTMSSLKRLTYHAGASPPLESWKIDASHSNTVKRLQSRAEVGQPGGGARSRLLLRSACRQRKRRWQRHLGVLSGWLPEMMRSRCHCNTFFRNHSGCVWVHTALSLSLPSDIWLESPEWRQQSNMDETCKALDVFSEWGALAAELPAPSKTVFLLK